MSRYIDADELKLRIDCHGTNKFGMLDEDIRSFIDEIPTVDAVSVVHGHWEVAIGYDPKKSCQCSECRLMAYEPTEYCPHCGAHMDEVTE